jgi:transcriptional regulator of acetoin/glycerol metabolism
MSKAVLHADHVRQAIKARDDVCAPLALSWQRCVNLHKLDPEIAPPMNRLSEPELRDTIAPMERLLAIAAPSLERLHRSIGPKGTCLLVSNTDGIPVYSSGSATDKADLQSWGLCRGVDWSEASSGTNGIGTSLVEQRALVVRQDQHFYSRALSITCASAPIFDHQGDLAGAVNVTFYGIASDYAPGGLLLSAVTEAARQIEIDVFHHSFPHARTVSMPGRSRSGAILLAVDKDDIVVGASRGARHVLGLTAADIARGVVASDLINMQPDTPDTAECGVLRRALVRNRGNVTAAARELSISLATMKRKIRQHGLDRQRLI